MIEVRANHKLTPHLLSQDFYLGIRNEINKNRLDHLEALSTEVPVPDILGSFENSDTYNSTLKILHLASLETRHQKFFLLRKVLPRLKSFRNILDIGIGNCAVTRVIARKFEAVSLIDIKESALNNVSLNDFRKCKQLELYHSCIGDVELPDKNYDLIMMAHVLYYIPEDKWANIIKTLYTKLREGGMIFIAVSTGAGKEEVIERFGGKIFNATRLYSECIEQSGTNVELYSSAEKYKSKDLRTMLHVSNIYLNEAKVACSRLKLENYFQNKYNEKSELFEFDTQQDFIIITK